MPKKLITVTVDTAVWLDGLDHRGSSEVLLTMLRWQVAGRLKIYASNRTFDPDTEAMRSHSQEDLDRFLRDNGVEIQGAPFRIEVSRIAGADMISGAAVIRSPEELRRFDQIVGPDPTTLPPENVGNRMPNKIGDYDSLRDHFAQAREVFVTTDTKDYLALTRRPHYERDLGLRIRSPYEFVREYSQEFETQDDV